MMGNTEDAMESVNVYTKQRRIAELTKQMPQLGFTSLNHHLDMEWMKEAYRRTRKDGAVGVDGQTGKAYGEQLEENLRSLIERAKSGNYKAPPVKRAYVPKGIGKEMRPIGIPGFEDKVLQRAVTMVMEPIYEQDFLDCSYGFRPGRSPHQAIQELWKQIMGMGGCWIVEADISQFFDTMVWSQLREFLQRRIRDGVVRRLIGKWLNAGVLEEGKRWYPDKGTPQGGGISPMLSNIYLHEVLDTWFEAEVKRRMKGRVFMIRYADDYVMGFECESDARRVMAVLPKRMGKYGLTIHPEKTRLVDFTQPRVDEKSRGTFDFLGFTHYWGQSRKGRMIVKRKTATHRLNRALKKIGKWCKANRHLSVKEQHAKLCQKLNGHYQYYGITGNARSLTAYLQGLRRQWCKWLDRRSRQHDMSWDRFSRLTQRYRLSAVRIPHSVYVRAS
jgi:RNA-directed DNA polymerase